MEYLGHFQADGTPAKPRTPSAYAVFTKQHFSEVKQQLPSGTPHKAIMTRVAELWRAEKAARQLPLDQG